MIFKYKDRVTVTDEFFGTFTGEVVDYNDEEETYCIKADNEELSFRNFGVDKLTKEKKNV